MRNRFEDLTEQEQTDFVKELQRIYNFGSACLLASAINANHNRSGWPTICLDSTPNNDIEISLCDPLDIIRDSNLANIAIEARSLFGFLKTLASNNELESLAVHQAMHDAFSLGIAAASLFELDFSGADEILDQLRGDVDAR